MRVKVQNMRVKQATFVAICAVGLGLLGVSGARAEIVLSGTTPANSFTDIGAQGFGNAPRLLTLEATGQETTQSGQIVWTGTTAVQANLPPDSTNQIAPPCCDGSKNSAPTLAAIGWDSGADVNIGFNATEAQGGEGTSITLTDLVLNLYNSVGTAIATFALGPDVVFSADDLALQTGNGNAVFSFVLTPGQQALYDAAVDLALSGTETLSTLHIGLGASFADFNGGPESFVAVLGPGAEIPLPPALVLFGTALAGMGLLGSRRRRKKGLVEAI
jgi:hypothetical protein